MLTRRRCGDRRFEEMRVVRDVGKERRNKKQTRLGGQTQSVLATKFTTRCLVSLLGLGVSHVQTPVSQPSHFRWSFCVCQSCSVLPSLRLRIHPLPARTPLPPSPSRLLPSAHSSHTLRPFRCPYLVTPIFPLLLPASGALRDVLRKQSPCLPRGPIQVSSFYSFRLPTTFLSP